jgi:hypothetical protein
MIFKRRGFYWRVNDRGFLEADIGEKEFDWFFYGWLDLI